MSSPFSYPNVTNMSGSQHNMGRYIRKTNDESKVNCIIDANNEIQLTRDMAPNEELLLFSGITNEIDNDTLKQTTDSGHTLELNNNATTYNDANKNENQGEGKVDHSDSKTLAKKKNKRGKKKKNRK